MATEAPPPPSNGTGTDSGPAQPTTEQFVEVQESQEFGELRRTYRSFAFPLTIAFIAWYLLYVLLSNYAGGFMGTKLFGNVNVALVLGLGQFATTFLIAWLYSRHAAAKLDPKAEAIKSRLESGLESRTEADA
ncbi:DUF485 domain-containing protein [Streptomyces sp. NPDC003943]